MGAGGTTDRSTSDVGAALGVSSDVYAPSSASQFAKIP